MPKVASSVGRGRPVAPPRPGFDSRVERISGPWGKKIRSSVFISKAWLIYIYAHFKNRTS